MCKSIFALKIVFFLAILLLVLPHSSIFVPIDASIGDVIGINNDNDSLHFGEISPGMSSKRSLILNVSMPTILFINVGGNISSFIHFSKIGFVYESKKINFFISPKNLSFGNYTGFVHLTLIQLPFL